MIIRTALMTDVDQIVTVHLKAFPGFFMTSLGRKFLTQYYKVYIQYSHVALVAEDDLMIEGFAVGSSDSDYFYQDLKKNILYFIPPIVINLINIKLLSKIFKRIHSIFFKGKVNSSLKKHFGFSELTSIGVMPLVRNKGLGSKLLKEYEQRCISDGLKGVTLTTDVFGNDRVLKFYKKSGYKVEQEFLQDNQRAMYSLIKYFNS